MTRFGLATLLVLLTALPARANGSETLCQALGTQAAVYHDGIKAGRLTLQAIEAQLRRPAVPGTLASIWPADILAGVARYADRNRDKASLVIGANVQRLCEAQDPYATWTSVREHQAYCRAIMERARDIALAARGGRPREVAMAAADTGSRPEYRRDLRDLVALIYEHPEWDANAASMEAWRRCLVLPGITLPP